MKKILTIAALFLFLFNVSFAQENILPNGNLEVVAPNFWVPINDGTAGAVCVWDLTQGSNSMRSFKVFKPTATGAEVGWRSVNNANLYWNNAAASVLYNLSFMAKTEGVNINPANDDEKIGVLFQFFAGGELLGEQFVEIDQSVATTDWTEYTGGLLLGDTEPDGVFITAKMGKDATGIVWFDNMGCGSDPWSMGVFNGNAEVPVGWLNWASGSKVGFANTVQGETVSGSWSALLYEGDDLDDEMVFYSEPVPAEPGKWYKITVWAKTEEVNNDPVYLPSNTVTQRDNNRMGLCFFFHKGLRTSWDLTPPGDMYTYFDQRTESTDWKPYSVVVKAPDEEVGGLSVRARFTSFAKGYCWYDNFSIEPIDPIDTNILLNGGLENAAPNFWSTVNDGTAGAVCVWDLTQGYTSTRSFKIYKPAATKTEVGWQSTNNADLYWNNAAASVLYNLSFKAKTEGVNINPANDDEKIGALFQFFAGSELLGEQFVELDQSAATTDWAEYAGGYLLGDTEPDGVYITLKMGKDATGIVWFDNIGCGTDPWSMGAFNGNAETPVGWLNWASGSKVGFANTVQGETHQGAWSTLLYEGDDLDDEMVFYSEPVPVIPNKWYIVSVWAKTKDVNADERFFPSNVVTERDNDRLGLCFFFHKGMRRSWDLTPPGDMYIYFDQTVASTDWTRYVTAIKAPAEEVEGLSVRARFTSFTKGYCWYDDFEILPFDDPKDSKTAIDDKLAGENTLLPVDYAVVKNYPNPFNPETTVEYQLPADATVTLTVYNLLGQQIQTLLNEFRLAGKHRVVWNGLDQDGMSVPSGIYIVRLTSEKYNLTHKMLLMK